MKIVILLAVVALCLADNKPNVPVTDRFGMPAFVDSEELLERALSNALYPSGVIDVDVDGLRHDMTAYEVEVYSRQAFPDTFQATLEKVLNTDLGFGDVTVKPGMVDARFRQRFYGHKERFFVYLNPATMMKELETLAQSVMSTTNLSLEDSRYD